MSGLNTVEKYYGKKITAIALGQDLETGYLQICFADQTEVVIHDMSDCCEHRYMTCDDHISILVGSALALIELSDGPSIEDEGGDIHEQMFLKITAGMNTITICTHNEHNGYYGGFCLYVVEHAELN